jgi:hypothetical protein
MGLGFQRHYPGRFVENLRRPVRGRGFIYVLSNLEIPPLRPTRPQGASSRGQVVNLIDTLSTTRREAP